MYIKWLKVSETYQPCVYVKKFKCTALDNLYYSSNHSSYRLSKLMFLKVLDEDWWKYCIVIFLQSIGEAKVEDNVLSNAV